MSDDNKICTRSELTKVREVKPILGNMDIQIDKGKLNVPPLQLVKKNIAISNFIGFSELFQTVMFYFTNTNCSALFSWHSGLLASLIQTSKLIISNIVAHCRIVLERSMNF